MDKRKSKVRFQQLIQNDDSPYTIEFGDESLGKTLDERIQAAKAAASSGRRNQKNNSDNNKFMTYNNEGAINQLNFNSQDTFSTNNNDLLETKKKSKQNSKQDEQVPQSFDLTNYSNLHMKLNSVITSKTSTRGNGIMQRRLEAVKARKLSNIFSSECDNVDNSFINSLTSKNPSSKNQTSKNIIKNNISISFIPKELSMIPDEKILPNQDLCSLQNEHCNRTTQSCSIPGKFTREIFVGQNRLI